MTGVPKFMRETMSKRLPLHSKLSLPATASLAQRMIHLGMHINCTPDQPEWILFRECYAEYCTKHILPALEKNQHVFIGGAQGIGKSVLTNLLTLLLVEEGHIVVLEHYKPPILIVGPQPDSTALSQVKSLLEAFGYDSSGISPNEVYLIDGDLLFLGLTSSECVTVIQDLGSVQGRTVTAQGSSKKIWISSPNAEKLKPIREDTQRLDLCVPPVTVEEMLEVRTKWNPYQYTEDQVRERHLKLGGSIRMVLGMSEAKSEDAIRGAILEANRETLLAAFGASLLELPKGTMSGVLLHPVPRKGNPKSFRLRFASKDIGRRLFNKLVSAEQRSVGAFLAVARKQKDIASFAGYALEASIHDQLCKGLQRVQAKKLEKTALGGVNFPGEFRIPKLTLAKVFSAEDFSDVPFEKLVENAYFRPASPDFPTIDSFAILPLSTFIPGAEGLCLVSFQSTTSERHGTNGAVLNRLFARVKRSQVGDARRYHVFLTGPNGIRTRQKIDMDRAEGGPYTPGNEPRIEQWAITLGDEFDELFDMLENSELDDEN